GRTSQTAPCRHSRSTVYPADDRRFTRGMTDALADILERHVAEGTAPGIIVVSGGADQSLVHTSAGDIPRDTIFRIQSMTKPVLAVATLRLVQDGRVALDDPVDAWLPELADREVLRTPASPLTDTRPADRSI